MPALTRDAFLKSRPRLPTETVEIPDFGTVIVRGLTGAERDKWEANLLPDRRGKKDLTNLRAKLIVLCVVDENGERIFCDADVAEIGQFPAAILSTIFDVAQRLSGFDAGEIEAAAKN